MNYSDKSFEFITQEKSYYSTPTEIIKGKLKLLDLSKDDVLVDFGCGNAVSLI